MNNKHTTYQPLGQFIRPVDERNRDLQVERLLGVSVNKCFIPSVANTIGTDMSNYKVVRKGQFVYIPDTSRRGDKIALSLLKEEECIVSQAYTVFEVIDTERLCPEYLMLWFSREEFDRYARFYSHGSAREVFDWDTLCATSIPLPSPEEQRRIVARFACLDKRIALCREQIDLLERTATALYRKTFVDGIDRNNLPEGWRWGALSEVGNVITGKTPSQSHPEDFGEDTPFVTPVDFQKQRYIVDVNRALSKQGTERLSKKNIPANSILITCIGSDMGKVSITPCDCVTNQQINSLIIFDRLFLSYTYQYFSDRQSDFQALASGSSTMPMLNKGDFEKIEFLIPCEEVLGEFEENMCGVNAGILNRHKQIACLEQTKQLLLTQIK